ncbi:MAG: hypothetical protein O3B01_09125 [Planctomycetota bacterium]|nr:hypothetical protein [Planctomycetota bacterium]
MKKHLAIISLFIIGLSSEGFAQNEVTKAAKENSAKEKAQGQKNANAKTPMTAEEQEEYNARVKSKFQYAVKYLNDSVAEIETRREELEGLIEQEKTSVSPPQPGMFSNALQTPPNHSAINGKKRFLQTKALDNNQSQEVPVTQEIKDAARAVIEAMESRLPQIHDPIDQLQERLATMDNPLPEAKGKLSNTSMPAKDLGQTKAAVDKAEADLSIVLASAWLHSMSQSQNATAKDSAVETTESLARYRTLKKQYEELGAQLGVVSEQLDDGVGNIVGALYPLPVKSRKTTENAPEIKKK